MIEFDRLLSYRSREVSLDRSTVTILSFEDAERTKLKSAWVPERAK